jgi:protein-tyrosine phosphatase
MSPLSAEGRYWVEPGRLQAGRYPGSVPLDPAVTFVVDLTEEGEIEPYRCEGVKRVRLPIRDFGTPSDEELTRILDTIDDALTDGEVVLVHCLGGRGRTGAVVGCYLVRHGLEPEAALARIAELRGQTSTPSPETREQIRLVSRWRTGA